MSLPNTSEITRFPLNYTSSAATTFTLQQRKNERLQVDMLQWLGSFRYGNSKDESLPRSLNSPTSMAMKTTMSDSQNRAILIAGLSCACVSFVAAFVALRWFVLMKRCFRHRLVLYLIASDTFKAVWYFIFAVVAIAKGPVSSDSGFCNASGFFLLFGVEAADFAILIIALHTMLSIFKPTSKAGEGGLYPYRAWIYPLWLGPPLLAASLAFINGNKDAYVTSGTYCYLPKRPFWYRLALSWIPRYLIISIIFTMYASIYIYVHVKFRGFSVWTGDESSQKSGPLSRHSIGPVPATIDSVISPELTPMPQPGQGHRSPPRRPAAFRLHSYSSLLGSPKPPAATANAPWDALSFITTRPLQDLSNRPQPGVASEDFAAEGSSEGSQETRVPPRNMSISNSQGTNTAEEDRKASEAPTMQTNYTWETAATHTTFDTTFSTMPEPERDGTTDHLRQTRLAIRRQLRFLFIYPLIYILMWSFPFAAHALNYDDYYVNHPVFWLSVVQTCSLALQAGVDSVVFSLREKPWRHIDDRSKWSMPRFKGVIVESVDRGTSNGRSNPPSAQTSHLATTNERKRNSSLWWEAEGRQRRDSVWMGTDLLSRLASNRDQTSNAGQGEIPEERDHDESRSTGSRQ